MRIKYDLFFHAIKFDDPTNLLLSFRNEVILVDSYIDIKIITCQMKILDDEISHLMPFFMMLMLGITIFVRPKPPGVSQ